MDKSLVPNIIEKKKYRTEVIVLIMILLLLPFGLVFHNLGFPQKNIFDEQLWIPTAQKYQNGVFFMELHPPLGKLLIAAGDAIYNKGVIHNDFVNIYKITTDWPQEDDITGYRLFPAIFGSCIPLLFFLIILRIVKNHWIAFFTSLLVTFDTALLIEARLAGFDVFLLFFILLSLLLFIKLIQFTKDEFSTYLLLFLFSFTAACASSVKETGLITLLFAFSLFLFYIYKKRNKIIFKLVLFVVIFICTYSSFIWLHFFLGKAIINNEYYGMNSVDQEIIFSKVESTNFFKKMFTEIKFSFVYSINFNKDFREVELGNPDEIGSPWYYWPLGGTAINYRWVTEDWINYRFSCLVGNPITWMFSLLGIILGSAIVISDLLFSYLERNSLRMYLYFFIVSYWSYLIPFWFIKRVMYLYHYLPALGLGIITMAIVISMTGKFTKRIWIGLILFTVAAILIFFFLKPFIYYENITEKMFEARNFWPFWNLHKLSLK
jgi:dolichyl-phosphate-mannose-protein mannosyltransferase